MKQLQKWFDLIAGISHDEQARLARAREIFADNGNELLELHVPACWRRTPRIARAG